MSHCIVWCNKLVKCCYVPKAEYMTDDQRKRLWVDSKLAKYPAKGKVIRDAVHGDIHIPDKYLAVIDAKEFQRLRRIKQLSVANMVFPSADHTRFSHSIGTFYIMQRLIEHFEKLIKDLSLSNTFEISEMDKSVALLAALLHDIGHGPFSHAFEDIFPNKSHEKWTREIIIDPDSEVNKQIIENFGPKYPEKVAELIQKQSEAKGEKDSPLAETISLSSITESLVSSQLDADRMDYLVRDYWHSGVKSGGIDLQRIIASLYLTVYENKYRICIPEKYIQDIESYLLARYHMQKIVYNHEFKRQMENVIRQTINEARKAFEEDNLGYCPAVVEKLLDGKELTVAEYTALDDTVLTACFSEWKLSENKTLSSLCDAVLNRHKAEKLRLSEDPKSLRELKEEIVSLLKKHGYSVSKENLKDEAFWIESKTNFSAYKPCSENILIQKGNGVIEDITRVSKVITNKTDDPIWQNEEKTVFINYNVINALEGVDDKEGLVEKLKQIIEQYSPRNYIEIEKKYCFDSEEIFGQIKKALIEVKTKYGFDLDEKPTKQQIDTYYDTENKTLYEKDYTLRTRKRAEKYELTIKKPVPDSSNTGQCERFEFQKAITCSAIQEHEEYIYRHIGLLDKSDSVVESLIIENERTPIILSTDNMNFEVVFDKVKYKKRLNSENVVNDFQLEIELKSDYIHRINLKLITDYLEDQIKELKPCEESKYKRGLKLLEKTKS